VHDGVLVPQGRGHVFAPADVAPRDVQAETPRRPLVARAARGEDADTVAVGHERRDGARPDVSEAAGDEDVHRRAGLVVKARHSRTAYTRRVRAAVRKSRVLNSESPRPKGIRVGSAPRQYSSIQTRSGMCMPAA